MSLNLESTNAIMPEGRFGFAREGYPFIAIGLFATMVLFWVFWPLGILALAFTLFTLYFFRDPRRQSPADASLLTSPADGTVLKIQQISSSSFYPEAHTKISIFMSPFNVHVNSIPCNGRIEKVLYHAGKFFVASLDKASEENERNTIVLQTPQGSRVAFTQIAGLVARRIVSYLKEGNVVKRGERYGLIRFGSRMEVCFPTNWDVLVNVGDKVKAVETPLATMR